MYKESFKKIYFGNVSLFQVIIFCLCWYIISSTIDVSVRYSLRVQIESESLTAESGFWKMYDITSGLSGNSVEQYAVCSDSSFYIVLDKGWGRFANGVFHRLKKPGGYPPSAMSCTDNGEVWVSSGNVKSHTVSIVRNQNIIPMSTGGFDTAILYTSGGIVWSGGRLSGSISRIVPDVQGYKLRGDFGYGCIYIGERPDGSIVAIGEDGYSIFKGGEWDTFSTEHSIGPVQLPPNIVASIAPWGDVWLVRKSSGKVIILKGRETVLYESIFDAIDEEADTIGQKPRLLNMRSWVKLEDGRILAKNKVKDTNGWTQIKALSHLKDDEIVGIHLTAENDVWYFTKKGIYKCKELQFGVMDG